MTYDPGRDPQNPLDVNPEPRRYRTGPTRGGMSPLGIVLGILALLLIGGFVFSMMSGSNAVRTAEPPAGQGTTTGTGPSNPANPRDMGTGTNPPAANTPTTAPKQ